MRPTNLTAMKGGTEMSIFWVIITGAIMGALARLIMKGDQNLGILWTIVLGALGAAGGYGIASAFDWGTILRWIISLALAIVFISLFIALTGRGEKTARR